MASTNSFTIDDAKLALADILEAFKNADNSARMEEAKDNAGNDMLKAMQIVFPLATQIQLDVIEKYGFNPDGEGIIRFTQTIKQLEKQDADIAEMYGKLRGIIMPQMGAPAPRGGAVAS